MAVVYVLFVCQMVGGQPAPPCSQGTKYETAAECSAMLRSGAAGVTSKEYQYADGSRGRADRDLSYICMSETTAPATWPVYRRLD